MSRFRSIDFGWPNPSTSCNQKFTVQMEMCGSDSPCWGTSVLIAAEHFKMLPPDPQNDLTNKTETSSVKQDINTNLQSMIAFAGHDVSPLISQNCNILA